MRSIHCLLAALLLGTGAARGANWFELDALSAATGLGIEADTDSVHHSGPRRAVTVRVTYPELRTHRSGASYRSVVATVEFSCEGGLAGYRDGSYYSEPRGSARSRPGKTAGSRPFPSRRASCCPRAASNS